MLDFDDQNDYPTLEKKIMKLQEKFELGDCEIIESSYKIKNGKKIPKYHGYFFGDAWHYFQCCEIIHWACDKGIVDPAFARWRMIRPNMVLRFSVKEGFAPKYAGTIFSKNYKPAIKWFKDFVYGAIQNESEISKDNGKKNNDFCMNKIGDKK
jgi:hypothetical protein